MEGWVSLLERSEGGGGEEREPKRRALSVKACHRRTDVLAFRNPGPYCVRFARRNHSTQSKTHLRIGPANIQRQPRPYEL